MLKIPLQSQSESELKFLELSQDSIPSDVNKLTFLLQIEKVPIGYWLLVGVSFQYLIHFHLAILLQKWTRKRICSSSTGGFERGGQTTKPTSLLH